MDALVSSAANVLYLLSYSTRDLLRLRILTVAAATILVAYFWTLPEPLVAVIAWNLFFIGLNLFHIARLLLMRRSEAPINMGKGKRP